MDVLRIANCSGFYGDRLSAAREQLDGGPIDVLCGDYLAEITMVLLERQRMTRPELGYAKTFVKQLSDVLGDCLDREIKVISNAGGVNPHACRDAVLAAAARAGLSVRVALVSGDDLLPRLEPLREAGCTLAHLHSGVPLPDRPVIRANAYLGAWGIVEALRAGADVVITGRVADASLAVAAAAWHFDWQADDWDRLAGATIAGHLLECSTQVTGGNYCFPQEVTRFAQMGFPIAEIQADGSCVITKHHNTGGAVNRGTVTSQMLWEIGSPAYLTPDVTAYMDSPTLEEVGGDRVRLIGARGGPPPDTLKAVLHQVLGFRNDVTFVLSGSDLEAKTRRLGSLFWDRVGGEGTFEQTRTDTYVSLSAGHALFRLAARHRDEERVGRAFSNAATDLVLASVAGATLAAPPGGATPCVGVWPTPIPRELVTTEVELDGVHHKLPFPLFAATPSPGLSGVGPAETTGQIKQGQTLGDLCGARAGDKGGDLNIGLWARDPRDYPWMVEYLTTDRIRARLPETFAGPIARHTLPNIYALNFLLTGYLGDGALARISLDRQGKTVAEHLRAQPIDAQRADRLS